VTVSYVPYSLDCGVGMTCQAWSWPRAPLGQRQARLKRQKFHVKRLKGGNDISSLALAARASSKLMAGREQMGHISKWWFRQMNMACGGLVAKAHRLVYHSRLESNKEDEEEGLRGRRVVKKIHSHDLYWRSPDSGDLWFKSRQSEKTVWWYPADDGLKAVPRDSLPPGP